MTCQLQIRRGGEIRTLKMDVLYKVIKGAEAEGKLKTIEALIDDQTSKDDEESWEKEDQEHQNICCYEYLIAKICTAWGEDTSITDRTANDFFQMRYVECTDDYEPKFDQYSLLIDMNELIKELKTEELLTLENFESCEQNLFKIFQRMHYRREHSEEEEQPLIDSLSRPENYFGIDQEKVADFITFRFKIDQLNVIVEKKENPLNKESIRINNERMLNHAAILYMFPENIYPHNFVVVKTDPYSMDIQSPKATLAGLICYSSKFDSYTTYLKTDEEWKCITEDKPANIQKITSLEDYPSLIHCMIQNLDFPVISTYEVVEETDILQKSPSVTSYLSTYLQEQIIEHAKTSGPLVSTHKDPDPSQQKDSSESSARLRPDSGRPYIPSKSIRSMVSQGEGEEEEELKREKSEVIGDRKKKKKKGGIRGFFSRCCF
ncbi:unnamed protein product [Moneuplotes crassus]|uniref:Uncharacterized protein n=1 Tax=Euplotes crassus TaxID=5936 RepID=A0AAD1U7Q4_EUPCR|nr:unnamed protein product [Moneuplotes crassus]